MSWSLISGNRLTGHSVIVFLFARILDLTSVAQRSLGILLVVVLTFPVYRSDHCYVVKNIGERCCPCLMNTIEDTHGSAVEQWIYQQGGAKRFVFRKNSYIG